MYTKQTTAIFSTNNNPGNTNVIRLLFQQRLSLGTTPVTNVLSLMTFLLILHPLSPFQRRITNFLIYSFSELIKPVSELKGDVY